MANVEKMIAETFLEMAQGLESGSYGKRPKIALTGMGSEHGEENAMEAALMAAKDGSEFCVICSAASFLLLPLFRSWRYVSVDRIA